jgi:hypothetical protein
MTDTYTQAVAEALADVLAQHRQPHPTRRADVAAFLRAMGLSKEEAASIIDRAHARGVLS